MKNPQKRKQFVYFERINPQKTRRADSRNTSFPHHPSPHAAFAPETGGCNQLTERLRGNYAFDLDSPCFPSSANQMEMTGETHHESIAPCMALQSAEMALSHIGLIAEGDERGADGE